MIIFEKLTLDPETYFNQDENSPNQNNLLINEKLQECQDIMLALAPNSPEYTTVQTIRDLTSAFADKLLTIYKDADRNALVVDEISSYNEQMNSLSQMVDPTKIKETLQTVRTLTEEYNNTHPKHFRESLSPNAWFEYSDIAIKWAWKRNFYEKLASQPDLQSDTAQRLTAMLGQTIGDARSQFSDILNSHFDTGKAQWDFGDYHVTGFAIPSGTSQEWVKLATSDKRFMDTYAPLQNLPQELKDLDKQVSGMVDSLFADSRAHNKDGVKLEDVVQFFTNQLTTIIANNPNILKTLEENTEEQSMES